MAMTEEDSVRGMEYLMVRVKPTGPSHADNSKVIVTVSPVQEGYREPNKR